MAATTVNIDANDTAMLSRYYGDLERTWAGKQLASALLQLSQKYGVYGGANSPGNAGIVGVAFDPVAGTLTYDISDTKAGDAFPYFN